MEGTTKIVLSKDDYDVEYKNNINAASESALTLLHRHFHAFHVVHDQDCFYAWRDREAGIYLIFNFRYADLSCRRQNTERYLSCPSVVAKTVNLNRASSDYYDVEYKNNINAASESAGEEAPEIIVTGKGAYSGTITRKFTIERESLEPQEETDDFDITATDAVYTKLRLPAFSRYGQRSADRR